MTNIIGVCKEVDLQIGVVREAADSQNGVCKPADLKKGVREAKSWGNPALCNHPIFYAF